MKYLAIAGAILIASTTAFSQIEEDKEAIKSQCGCHEIDFDFVETLVHQEDYERHEPYHAHANAEWIFVDEESDDKLVIQHLLIVNGNVVIKHWREDWIFENRDLHTYAGDNEWTYEQLSMSEVQGEWTQKVFQVTDAPRYQASAPWIHTNNSTYWESTTNAPLPRREYSVRHDYNVMVRTNRHEILDSGYNHLQNNVKTVVDENGNATPIVTEAGYNRYRKVDEELCQVAKDWWEANNRYWRIVRETWSEVLPAGSDIEIALVVDEKMLYDALNELAVEMQDEKDEDDIRDEVLEVLQDFVTAKPANDAVGNL